MKGKRKSPWHSVYCLKDSGATLVVINQRLVEAQGLTTSTAEKALTVRLADNSTRQLDMVAEVELDFHPGYRYVTKAHVMDLGPNVEVILGTPWLKSLGPHMADWDAGTLTFRDRHRTVTLKSKRRGQRWRATWEGIEFITNADIGNNVDVNELRTNLDAL